MKQKPHGKEWKERAAIVELFGTLYRLAETRFLQIEVPDKPDKLPVWEAFANSQGLR